MLPPGDHLLWRSLGDIVYILNVRDGRYAGLSGRDAERWVGGFGSARTTRPVPASPPPRLPRWWSATRYLLAWRINRHVRRLIAAQRFHELYALAESVSLACPGDRRGAVPLAPFLRTELLFKHKNPDRDCLVRSFSLYLYLRLLGFRVTHRIGFVAFPFDAHAWVELEGRAILERVSSMERWHVISTLGEEREAFPATA